MLLLREVVDKLAFLCRETNWRLVVATREAPPDGLAPLFDETVQGDGKEVEAAP